MRMWKAEAEGEIKRDGQMKLGCTRLTIIDEMVMPIITKAQNTAYGILCAMEVETSPTWRFWADRWLSGEDRSEQTARSAANAAYAAASAAAASAAAAAANAAYAAASAAAASASAAEDAAEDAAAEAAYAAEDAAAEAAVCESSIDLIALAKKAMEVSS
jgi:hypothetical protein